MVILKVICEGRFSSLLVLVSRPVEVTRRFNAVKTKSLVEKQSIMAFKIVNPSIKRMGTSETKRFPMKR